MTTAPKGWGTGSTEYSRRLSIDTDPFDSFLDAGPFVEAIEYACDIEAVIIGKPSIDFFEQVLSSIQLKPEQVALTGDDIYGDIQGALNASLESRLVRTGKYRDGDENKTTPKANVVDNVLAAVEDCLQGI